MSRHTPKKKEGLEHHRRAKEEIELSNVCGIINSKSHPWYILISVSLDKCIHLCSCYCNKSIKHVHCSLISLFSQSLSPNPICAHHWLPFSSYESALLYASNGISAWGLCTYLHSMTHRHIRRRLAHSAAAPPHLSVLLSCMHMLFGLFSSWWILVELPVLITRYRG